MFAFIYTSEHCPRIHFDFNNDIASGCAYMRTLNVSYINNLVTAEMRKKIINKLKCDGLIMKRLIESIGECAPHIMNKLKVGRPTHIHYIQMRA